MVFGLASAATVQGLKIQFPPIGLSPTGLDMFFRVPCSAGNIQCYAIPNFATLLSPFFTPTCRSSEFVWENLKMIDSFGWCLKGSRVECLWSFRYSRIFPWRIFKMLLPEPSTGRVKVIQSDLQASGRRLLPNRGQWLVSRCRQLLCAAPNPVFVDGGPTKSGEPRHRKRLPFSNGMVSREPNPVLAVPVASSTVANQTSSL